MTAKKTVIVTGASQGIGAAVVHAFLDRGYGVVATSRNVSGAGFPASANLALVDGDIGHSATAERVTQTAIAKFGSIDSVVNNAGIFAAKPFTDYTADDFHRFVSTNLEGFLFITQLAVKQMLRQGSGGWVRAQGRYACCLRRGRHAAEVIDDFNRNQPGQDKLDDRRR
ncbi:MAG: SDR family NAD(P)-dependent oxidoreductase [Candidatus Korobacteraceae bacterium]